MGTEESREKECWHPEEKRYRKRVRMQEKGRQETTKQRGMDSPVARQGQEGLMSLSAQPTTGKKGDKQVLLSSRV